MYSGLREDRRTTLDPGLTALALRGRDRPGRYPFIDRALRPRRWWVTGAAALSAYLAAWRRPRPPDG